MRAARDAVLASVHTFLIAHGFAKKKSGAFVRAAGERTEHVSFQKLSSGRAVRLFASTEAPGSEPALAPLSDSFTFRRPDGSRPYNFSWSTDESSISRCADEFCRYLSEIIFPWFESQR